MRSFAMQKCVLAPNAKRVIKYKPTQFDPETDFQAQLNLHGIGQKTFKLPDGFPPETAKKNEFCLEDLINHDIPW